MTVNELLSAAAALFFETDTSAYGEVALPFWLGGLFFMKRKLFNKKQ